MAKSAKKGSAKAKTKPKVLSGKAKIKESQAKSKPREKKITPDVKEVAPIAVYSAASLLINNRMLTAEGWKKMVIKNQKKEKK